MQAKGGGGYACEGRVSSMERLGAARETLRVALEERLDLRDETHRIAGLADVADGV
jgi:hypothetical protein